jgi:hypothetical protein
MGIAATAEKAGYDRAAIFRWRYDGIRPSIQSFDDMLGAIGYKLAIVPMEENKCIWFGSLKDEWKAFDEEVIKTLCAYSSDPKKGDRK